MIISKIPTAILNAAVKFATHGSKNNITTVQITAAQDKSHTFLSLYNKNAEFNAIWSGNAFIGRIPEDGVIVSIYGTPPPSGLATISTTGKSVIFEETASKTKAIHAIVQAKNTKKAKEWHQLRKDYIDRFNAVVDLDDIKEAPLFYDFRFLTSIYKGFFMMRTRKNSDESVKLIDARKPIEERGQYIGSFSTTFLDAEAKCDG